MDSTVRVPPSLAAFARRVLPLLYRQMNGRRILGVVKAIMETDRWNSFDRFHDTTTTLVRAYEAAGATAEVYSIQTGGPLGWGRWIIPEAEDVRGATVDIVAPIHRRLLDYRRNPFYVAQWSAATAARGVRCSLVVVDSDEELALIPARGLVGKFVLTRLKIGDRRRQLYEKGAVGVIADALVPGCPDAVAWTKFGWGGLALGDSRARMVGLAISAHEGDRLRQLIRKHSTVEIVANVDIRHYAGAHDVVSGIVKGRDDPQDEVWAVAHNSEPGALDNTSGVAVCIEIARVLNLLAKSGTLPPPRRSIRLLHGYECYGFFHFLEHQKRFQPPLAGVCVDSVGAKPAVCRRELRWHATIPASAGFVDDVGDVLIRAALRLGRPGYHYVARPFVSTEDTLLADPKHGFPCPWLTNHPSLGYHSSADVVSLLHPRGLASCAAALAGYLYFLADAGTQEALELAAWQTDKTVERFGALSRQYARMRLPAAKAQLRDAAGYAQQRHASSLQRLRRWLWGGERSAISARFAACERRVAEAARPLQARGRKKSAAECVPYRAAPLSPTAENTWPETAKKMRELPKWAAYWADGKRSLFEIASLLRVELRRDVSEAQVRQHFEALAEIKYVELVCASELITAARLVRDLRALGVRPGMDLLVHSSLSKIGRVAGGADTVIEALLTVLGRTGTLLAPSFNHFLASVFNPLATPTTNGAVPDALWRRPDAVRSLHPTHAVCAIGPKAAAWCAGHLENGVWAADSPIGRLIHNGGYVLLLGVDHHVSTAYHVAEISLCCGCLDQFASRDRVVMPDGRVQEVPGLAWRAGNCPVRPRKLNHTLDRRGLQAHGMVGNACATLVQAIHVWQARRDHLRSVCPACKVQPDVRNT